MAEGTNVGNIFLDLIVRNTIGEQVNKIAQEGQTTAKKAFSGMEKEAEQSVNRTVSKMSRLTDGIVKVGEAIADGPAKAMEKALAGPIGDKLERTFASFTKLGDKIANGPSRAVERVVSGVREKTDEMVDALNASVESCGEQIEDAISKPFDKGVALAQARVKELEDALEGVRIKAENARWTFGYNDEGDKAGNRIAERLAEKQESIYSKLMAAKERLRIQEEAAAQKAEAALQKSLDKQKQAEQKAAAEAEKAAQRAVAAAEKAASRRKAIHAKMWKNMLAKAGDASKKITGKILGIDRGLDSASRSGRRFSSRLREIASGALLFNGISRLLHNLTSYLGNAVTSTDQMKQALANLKGAAATAAAPIIQALTPALSKLANMAATVFSYVSKLISFFTGKSVSSMSAAAKKMNASATNAANKAGAVGNAVKKAAASLASFDEIEKASSTDDTSDSGSIDGEEYLPNYDFNGRSPFLDSLLEAIKAGRWEQVGGLIAEKINESLAGIPWDNIQNKVRSGMEALADVINGFVDKLNWPLLGHSIAEGLNTITTGIDAFFQRVNWQQLGTSLGAGLNQLFTDLDWETLGRVLTDRFRAVFETLHGFVAEFDPTILAGNLVKMISAAINNVNWPQLVTDLCTGASKLLDGLILFFQEFDWGSLGRTLGQCVENIRWAEVFSKLGTLLWEAFKAALEVLVEFIKSLGPETIWGGIMAVIAAVAAKIAATALIKDLLGSALVAGIKAVGTAIVTAIGGWPGLILAAIMAVFAALALAVKDGGVEVVQGFFLGIQEKLVNIGQWLNEHIFQPFVEAFKSLFGIHSPSTVMEEFGIFLIEGLLNGITNTWNAITEFFSGALEKIRAVVTGSLGATEETSANAWNSMESDATNAGSSIDAAAQSAWGSVSQSAVTNLAEANATVSEQLLLMQENAALALEQLQLRLDQSLIKLRESLVLTWKDTATNINRQITDMKTTVLKSVESLRQEMDAVWAGICEDTNSVIGKLSDSAKTGIDQMCAAAVESFRTMHREIRQEWEQLDVYLRTMLITVNRTFQEQWNSLQLLTEKVWKQITDSVSSLAEEMEREVTKSITAMSEKLSSTWPEMANNAIRGFENMLNGIITICSSIISAVQGMCNSVATMCSNAISMINQVNRAAAGMSYSSSASGSRSYSGSSSSSSSRSATGVTGYGGSVSYVTGKDYTGGAGGSSMHLATGGITTGPTEALIGEAGREAVLPLERNLGYLDPLARKITDMIRGSLNVQPVLTMVSTSVSRNTSAEYGSAASWQDSSLAELIREVMEQNRESMDQIVDVLREILEAVLGIEIGDDVIAGAVTRYQKKMAMVKGVHT